MSNVKYEKLAKICSVWMIILGAWFMLAFIGGIDYLVAPWRINHGTWFWISISLLVNVFAAALVCWRKLNWSHYFVLSVTGSWLIVQFFGHWVNMIWPPESKSVIESYYSHYKTWYLIPRMSDRIVPDGYHVILSVLICICFYQGIKGLLISIAGRKQHS